MGSGAILPLLGLLACWTYLPPLSADLGICLLPPDGGLCFILQERWYYDRERKKCLPFSWGGCGGNENNFESRQECELACGSYAKPGSCPVPEEVGICMVQCNSDYDCPRKHKCCFNGCGVICTAPVHDDKPGSCPDRFPMSNSPFTGLGVCRSNCAKDGDCKENLKCCANGCGHWVCTKPKA